VWLHGTTSGGGAAYCVNPGAIAYGAIGTYKQAQFSGTSQLPCDYGVQGKSAWVGPGGVVYQNFECVDGFTESNGGINPLGSTLLISGIYNPCQTRIWMHDANGNAVACVDPHSTYYTTAEQLGEGPVEFQITFNQAPCSAGNP
jgi:hypothetical protein